MARLILSFVLLLLIACTPTVAPLPPAPPVTPTPVPPPVAFPLDAAPHDALMEWWYFTGHLRSETDHEYGFEFTIFQTRRHNAPAGYLAHFAVTDVTGQRFSHQARFTQADPRTSLPLDVGGWTLARDGDAEVIEAQMLPGPAADPAFSLRLRLIDRKAPALHNGGFIDMGQAGGSYYYSRTRLEVSGSLGASDRPLAQVSGQGWMDHQWGNFVVAGGGWDWFALQFDDMTELMLYVLRDTAGTTTAVYGTYVEPDGSVRDTSARVEALGEWTSPHTGARYPSGWQITLGEGQRLTVMPRVHDQELYFPEGVPTPVYWEGAVTVDGDRRGLGYVELTGYAN